MCGGGGGREARPGVPRTDPSGQRPSTPMAMTAGEREALSGTSVPHSSGLTGVGRGVALERLLLRAGCERKRKQHQERLGERQHMCLDAAASQGHCNPLPESPKHVQCPIGAQEAGVGHRGR